MNRKIIIAAMLLVAMLAGACAPANTGERQSHYPTATSSSIVYQYEISKSLDGGVANESYLEIAQNSKVDTADESMLTFSLKVDTAAYTNIMRHIDAGSAPPADAVRTEELINYFSYDAEVMMSDDAPFGIYTEVAASPFDADKLLAFIRVKTPDIDKDELPPSNLTFLIDTSGSMDSYDKLPLLKNAFGLLVETLDEDDRVSIVTYAGGSAIVLDSVPGSDTHKILNALDRLSAGGSTAGADGINTAYRLAELNFIEGGNNRVILATDGDFNVGVSSNSELSKLIQEKRDSGVYLSILGFGTGNIRDDLMETLSKDGNGNYSYIDSIFTAQKVLVDELASNLFTVANDVKAQVEFNPQNVKSYRLIGYENRALANEDFADDTKDAGEIGVGTDVVAMFELSLSGEVEYKYQSSDTTADDSPYSDELFEVRIRYKDLDSTASKLVTTPVYGGDVKASGSADFNFACSVAAFGELLRGSEYADDITASDIAEIAENNLGNDTKKNRKDFVRLVKDFDGLND